jgi:hypothetical protein
MQTGWKSQTTQESRIKLVPTVEDNFNAPH